MNLVFIFLALTLSYPAFADTTVIKNCSAEVKGLGAPGTLKFEIRNTDGKLTAKTWTQAETELVGYRVVDVRVHDGKVRSGLTKDSNTDDLSFVEKSVAYAMQMTESDEVAGLFSAGLQLKDIASATAYEIDPPGPEVMVPIGAVVVIEARDANNQVLGSFLSGFVVSPCF